MNVRKMRQVGKDILAEPRRFNMRMWFTPITNREEAEQNRHSPSRIPPCGTACCFAGAWALRYGGVSTKDAGSFIYEGPFAGHFVSSAAVMDLDLPNAALFLEDSWPERLRTKAKAGTKRYAENFVHKVLEDYIKTNGWETEWETEACEA